MAEIGLVASIFGVAAFGTSVATALYETADVMINAKQQICALAKHVSQSTAVLKHMGQVLEAEKTICSKELLRDIRKIKHSCKRTFKEINSTVKSSRLRHFVRIRWLFKRTKASELEARLNSQQSMLQCVIQTLTVSKLGHMDSRSKQDSKHIGNLKVEIRLLRTFIMENYNNLRELRYAEQTTVVEAQTQSPSFQQNPIGGSNAYKTPITRSPSSASIASEPENDDSNSDAEAHDDDDNEDDDANSKLSRDQNDEEGAGPPNGKPGAGGLAIRFSSLQPQSSYTDNPSTIIRRESSLLLQMVPYRSRLPDPIRSDRLIPGRQESDIKSGAQEAIDSVRLLLDKWTTLGSAPVSKILDEEAAQEEKEAEMAKNRRKPGPQSNAYRRPPSPGAVYDEDDGPTYYPGSYENPHFQDNQVSPPLRDDPLPHYGYFPHRPYNPQQKNFWRSSYAYHRPPERQLGNEILVALRSSRGGIYYMKSNQFKQVHYVDQYPIYVCALVPSHIIPYNEWKPLHTELGKGLVRKEALDLLGYSYTETEMGTFSLSGDLDLMEIEELVKLSYQALDRYSKERSKTVIKERGWSEVVDSMNHLPGVYQNEPSAPSQYPPPMPESWNQNQPSHGGYTWQDPYADYDNIFSDERAPSLAPVRYLRTHKHPSTRQRASHVFASPTTQAERQKLEKTEEKRPELRFTRPRAQLGSIPAGSILTTEPSAAVPIVLSTKTDDELLKARQKLEQMKKRKVEAETVNDLITASDITYYVIPDLEARIERLLRLQREERDGASSQPEESKKSYQAAAETENEASDDEGGLEGEDLYDCVLFT